MFEHYIYVDGVTEESDVLSIIQDTDEDFQDQWVTNELMPVLALKNTVLFPGITIPITVGRDKSLRAVNKAYKKDRMIAVLSQKNMEEEEPGIGDLYEVGTVAKIMKLLRMPDGTVTVILQGKNRFALTDLIKDEPFIEAQIQLLQYEEPKDKRKFEAMVASIRDLAAQIIKLSPNIPSEAVVMLNNIENNHFLLEFIASNLAIDIKGKQTLLEESNLSNKATSLLKQMNDELQLLELRDQIENKVRGDIEKQQRDYFLNQQLKTIQEELGQNPIQEQLTEIKEKATKKKWAKQIKETFNKELEKLKRMNPQVAEYSVQRNYLDVMLDLPWGEYTEDNFDLKHVQKVLDKDHSGLKKVKDRIIEHLAVLKLKGDMKAPILCLVGPPGVGKTSLGRSIAKALDRKFVRMSLGGLHDESEIRGHRRTYIGAMPGRIIQSLKKAESSNPVFILDEIDKVGKDFRGDPSSALLEVLDPEQNETFSDNYLEVEYDLSKIMFIATANALNTIQPALRDRMEIIEISGYSEEEKLEIAKKHLVPKQRKEHGLKASQVKIGDSVLKEVISKYTRESGVRNLNRRVAALMRSAAKDIAMSDLEKRTIKKEEVAEILGPPIFKRLIVDQNNITGVAVGLAWTSVGGDILFIEASTNKGKGRLMLTGNLGDVMKESANAALSYIKSNHEVLGLDEKVFQEKDVHIHIPEGAIPKDGPSAGITMATALLSILSGRTVKPHLAMTGEITLRGKVLPVGGIKEKVLAAKRSGVKEIIMCSENEKHVFEIESDYLKGLTFHYVDSVHEVFDLALTSYR